MIMNEFECNSISDNKNKNLIKYSVEVCTNFIQYFSNLNTFIKLVVFSHANRRLRRLMNKNYDSFY